MMQRALGVDFGSVRIGLAISDALGIAATPIEVLEGLPQEQAAQRIAAIAADRETGVLVFGMPINMDGTEHASTGRVQAFADLCAARSKLPVEFVDERLTTIQAERHLRSAGQRRKGRKQKVDKVAAALLLQAWLDAHR